ncbi:MAG: TonB C-terminal domain-containing protein [Longimicrobiales bacterium]|nr:TonB C-terminal domain-containing protein [Longimicrobiales bacterium]
MRRRDPFDRTSLGASLGVHLGLLMLAVGTSTSVAPPAQFVSYQIELVSPPPLVQGTEDIPSQEQLVVDRPDPEPPQPDEREAPVVEDKPAPKPPAPDSARPNPLAEPGEETKPGTSTAPASPAGVEGGEGINVRLEGVRRDYPAYYGNIIRQIQRCFRWQGEGRWETTVYFVINRDGTVSDLAFVKRSGNAAFDFEAMGAVDCAGKGRFGLLPEDLPFDRLPVQFNFRPQGAIGGTVPAAVPTTSAGPAKAP